MFAPEGVLVRPRYLLEWRGAGGGLPNLTTPNLATPGEQGPDVLRRLRRVSNAESSNLAMRLTVC